MNAITGPSPTLNYDIFVHIMAFLPPPSLFSLMLTCRSLYEAGMPFHLGRKLPPIDAMPDQMDSLFTFLLADPSRPCLVRSLALDASILTPGYIEDSPNHKQSSGLVKKIVKVLNQASQLRELHIRHTDQVLASDDSLCSAISSLSTLNQLDLQEADSLTYNLLRRMRSPISSLGISFSRGHDWDSDNANDFNIDPIDLFANFKDTLAYLDIMDVGFQSKDIQFPNVHTLQLCRSEQSDTAALCHCFPNIRRLSLNGQDPDFLFPEFVEDIRSQNTSTSVSREVWNALEVLKGRLAIVYILGLKLSHPLQTWDGLQLVASPLQKQWFHTLLVDLRPLRISTQISLEDRTVEDLEDVFPKSSITHLRLCMDLFLVSSVDTMVSITDTIISWASRLELQFLEIHIEQGLAAYWPIEDIRDLKTQGLVTEPILNSLRINDYLVAWDLEIYARRLAFVCPHLRYVFIHVKNCNCGPGFFEITREGLDIHLRSLVKEEAQKILEDADFTVSSHSWN